MNEFVAGLAIGIALGLTSLCVYKRTLVRVAYSNQNEKILGEWFCIKPLSREVK